MEKEFTEIRKMYAAIPTLDPAKAWRRDESVEGMVHTTEEYRTFKTAKVKDFKVVYEATEHHPAVIEPMTKDETIGHYLTTYKSGKLTTLKKSQLLKRVDDILLAIKKARSEANQVEVKRTNIGTDLLNYINRVLE